MKKILAPILILFFTLPLFASAQARPAENPAFIDWVNKVGEPVRKRDGTIGYPLYPERNTNPVITGPNGSTVIDQAKKEELLFLYNTGRIDPATGKPIKAVGKYDPNAKINLQEVRCKKNLAPIFMEGALHTIGQVWICTYTDATGKHEFYIPQHHSDDTLKLFYEDLEKTEGRLMFIDPKKNALIPPPASTVFHAPVLMRQINAGAVLMPDGKPLPPKLLNLKIKGGEPWVSVDILGLGKNESSLPKVAMTPETKPVVGPNGISVTLLEPQSPISGSPTAGVVPDDGGFTGGGSKPITPRTAGDIFHGNIPFAGGVSIFIPVLTINWRSGPPEPMVSGDGKALAFFMGFNGVPFITFLTDADTNHIPEAHIVLFEFDESEKGKPENLRDWSKIKPVKEFASYEDFVKYVNN